AIMDGARAIANGDGDLIIACGVESMSRAPFVMPKSSAAFAREPQIFDTTLGWRFVNKKLSEMYYPYTMGETAENVARRWNISRNAQDEFASESQQKFAKALASGKWTGEVVPVQVQIGKEV